MRYYVATLALPQKVVQLYLSLRSVCLPRRKRQAELVLVAQTSAVALSYLVLAANTQ